MQSRVVLSGQVKQYFACESQHQQGAFFHMTGGFYDFFKMSNPLTEFQGSFFFLSLPIPWEMIQFDGHIFQTD